MSKSKAGPDDEALNYFQLFQALPASYLLLKADSPRFTIVDLNKARERLTNVRREDAIGQPLLTAYPNMAKRLKDVKESQILQHLELVLRTGKVQGYERFPYQLPEATSHKARTRYWSTNFVPVKLGGRTNGVTHILVYTEDVTEEHSNERRMARAERRLAAAHAIGKVGSWVFDVEEDRLVGDDNFRKLFSLSKRDVAALDMATFLQSVHPDDRLRITRAVKRSVAHGVPFDEEYRVVLSASDQTKWVLARGKPETVDGKVMFPGVVVDITERHDLQAQVELGRRQDRLNRQAARILQERNDELEAISRTKDEFVALASHQLRTPATAVKQYLGMVLQGYVGEITDMQAEMLGKAFESNERQIHIINQILNAARVDTGSLVMAPVPMDLSMLVRAIATDMEGELARRKHVFQVHVPPRPVPVAADMGYLRMAIENILHNASVYTPEGGTIAMKLERVGGRAVLSIADTGVGIKKTDLNKLFVKFSRIHNALSVQAGGSGIGLYLTAEIVRLHGGSVSVESKIRRGTTFAISLPLAHNTGHTQAVGRQTAGEMKKQRPPGANMRSGLQPRAQNPVQ